MKTIEKDKYIIFVGNIKKHKGLMTLYEAIKGTDIMLYIVGESNNFRTSDKEIDLFIKEPNIKYTGKLSD